MTPYGQGSCPYFLIKLADSFKKKSFFNEVRVPQAILLIMARRIVPIYR
jgi:hypothetical protein